MLLHKCHSDESSLRPQMLSCNEQHREELDKELDLYMAQGPNAKAALDKDLDSYMAQAK